MDWSDGVQEADAKKIEESDAKECSIEPVEEIMKVSTQYVQHFLKSLLDFFSFIILWV